LTIARWQGHLAKVATAPRRSVHRTQWAAQFAVASELCKQGYEVALTLGNHPSVDLMVVSPDRRPFLIDVKGLYRRNYWVVKRKAPQPDLFYVFAFVPDAGSNRFFILSQEQVNDEIAADLEANRQRAAARQATAFNEDFTGVTFAVVEKKYEDAWRTLPR
jgi:hypothetical protein